MDLIPTIDERLLRSLLGRYWCEQCGETFKTKTAFDLHSRNNHS